MTPPGSSADSARSRVVIVGGGISGLAAAHALERLSEASECRVEIVLLEAAPRTGGNIRSERLSGFLCEWGPNGFLDNAPATLALLDALGLQGRVQVSEDAARRRFIYRKGKLRRVPEGIGAFLASDLLSWPGKLRIAAEPLIPRRAVRAASDGSPAFPQVDPALDDETIHAFAARRIGREAADVLIAAMVRGIFAGDARDLSLAACFPRMRQMEDEYGGLVRAMLALRKRKKSGEGARDLAPVGGRPGGASAPSAAPGMPSGRLTSFREGMEELTRALTGALGPIVRTSVRVMGVSVFPGEDGTRPPGRPRYRIDVGTGTPLEADAVLISASAREAARMLGAFDSELAEVAARVPAAPLSVVCLGFETSDVASLGAGASRLDGFGFLVPPGEGPRILGALWDSSVYPGRAPEGKVLMRAMIGGGQDRGAVDLSDADMLDIVRADLATVMGLEARPLFTRIFRHPLGIPQYTVGHLANLAALDSRLRKHPGLFLTGNSYRGVSLNACIAEAEPAARNLLAAATATASGRPENRAAL